MGKLVSDWVSGSIGQGTVIDLGWSLPEECAGRRRGECCGGIILRASTRKEI